MTNLFLAWFFKKVLKMLALSFMNFASQSIKYFEIAQKLNPKFINLYSNYGNALFSLKKFDQAKTIFLKGIEVDNQNSTFTL